MRKLLRSVLKVTDESGHFRGSKAELSDNFQEIYHASDLEWPGPEQDVWNVIRFFWIEHQDLPTPEDVRVLLERDLKSDLKVLVDEISVIPYLETASVRQHIENIRTDRQKRQFLLAAKEAMLIAAQGHRVEKQDLKGVPDATRYLMSRVVPLMSKVGATKIGGNPREDGREMKELYLSASKDHTRAIGILTGIDKIDAITYGIQLGNMFVVAAFTSEGKTTIMMNMVYNAVFRQGFNSVVFSREMPYDQLRMLFYVIHSNHPRFAGEHEPLKYDEVKNGKLDPAAADFYLNRVIPDFTDNTDYGNLHIVQPSISLSLTDVQVKAEYLNTQFPVDLICIDYLSLLSGEPGRRYSDSKDRMNTLYIEAKQLALSFNSGLGTRILTGHQINRKGRESAEEAQGIYRTQALSDANEAERSSDVIIANYLDQDLRAMGESKVTCLKNRDGKVSEPFNLLMRLEHRYIGNLTDAEVSQDQLLELDFL